MIYVKVQKLSYMYAIQFLIQFFRMLSQGLDPVKLLVHFPSQANLDDISEALVDRYYFIQGVKKSGKNELLISFDCMSDLLEIDFIEQFGALSTKVKNSSSFCKEMNQSYHNSTSDAGSSNKIINCGNADHFESENMRKDQGTYRRRERLTSLEDEVNEYQQQIRKLALFDGPPSNSRVYQGNKNEDIQQTQTHLSNQSVQVQEYKKQSMWSSVIHGVAITSLIVGGIKAIKFLFK